MPVPEQAGIIDRISAKERIYQTLRNWIIEGTLQPGEKLLDAELCQYFGVSRTPVREAFQMLEMQKLVHVKPGKATCVTEIDLKNLQEWYIPLAHIQGLAAELACIHAKAHEISQLESMNGVFGKALASRDIKAILEADLAFHRKILKMAGIQYLSEFSEMLFLHIQRIEYRYFAWTEDAHQSVDLHGDIIDAFRNGDGRTAGEKMKQNWFGTMKLYDQKLGS